MNKVKLNFKPNFKKLYSIEKATPGSAGFDLVAATENNVILNPGSSNLIPCGFSMEMPTNLEAQVRPRSGLALKNMITVLNSPGTIDSDYRGEVCVILINHSKREFIVEHGMRIAQLIFCELPNVSIIETDSLSETVRGKGGFGSTGLIKDDGK